MIRWNPEQLAIQKKAKERRAEIVRLHDVEGFAFTAIAVWYGLTPVRIQQLYKKGLRDAHP